MCPKTVGILGGMGPEATVDLMHRVIRATPAADDCDHIHMVVDNNPQVPSRIKALVEKRGQDPLPCLQEMARKLEAWGVDFLAMPCNTAHYYHSHIQSAVDIPLLNMVNLSAAFVVEHSPSIRTAGILASSAVLDLGLYAREFENRAVAAVYPDSGPQDGLMQVIRRVKTGNYGRLERELLKQAADNLVDKGAEVICIACTEFSILVEQLDIAVQCYDTAQVLARAIVHRAKQ